MRRIFDHRPDAHEPAGQHAASASQEIARREACKRLWHAVLERAVKDMEYLAELADQDELGSHEKKRREQILESPPSRFIESRWFRTICDGLGLEVDEAWRLLDLDRFDLDRPPADSGPVQ